LILNFPVSSCALIPLFRRRSLYQRKMSCFCSLVSLGPVPRSLSFPPSLSLLLLPLDQGPLLRSPLRCLTPKFLSLASLLHRILQPVVVLCVDISGAGLLVFHSREATPPSQGAVLDDLTLNYLKNFCETLSPQMHFQPAPFG